MAKRAETDRELGAHAAARRLRTRTLATLISIWALVWIGAVAGIYFLFPVTSTVEAPVKFSNFDLLTINERHQLQDEQKKLLEDENTRRGAHRILTLKDNEIGPGFLEDTESYLATASLATWPESKRGTMVLQHRGKEDAGDRSRMLAMAQALYEANKPRIDEAAAVQKRFDDLNVNLKTNQQTQQQLAAEIEKLRIQGDSAPDGPAINKIKDDIAKLDKSWGDAVVALKNCQADLAQLKQSASPSTQPANGAGDATASSTSDSQVSQMETQLKDLSTKMSAAQAAKTEQAAEARKALDATLGDFEKQVAATRELMKDSPELASYVAAAQQLQETTRSLIDDLIRRQEQQYSRLNELKTTLTEKMEQRRVELQNADPQLKELNERLETATRQLNAAKSAGMQKEIEDKKSEVDLLAAMVRSRQEQLPKDTLKDYADTIAQLQQIIDVTQKNVEDDRKRTDQLLAQLQTSFTSSQSVEKLPEAQKSAAADLEKRLADINKAREQYNTAISATAVNEDESVKQMRTQIAALQTDIDARKKEVADATQRNLSQQQEKSRQELIDQKESQLSDLTKTEADARLAYTNREKDLRDAQASAQTARESAERLQTLQDQKTKLDAQIAQDTRDVEARKTDADHAVTPIAPSDGEVSVRSDTDRRPWFYLWSSLAIFFGFGTMLMLKMREPTTRLGGFDVIRPMPINGAANSSNGHSNGDSADAANHQDLPAEDREVASI